MHAAAKAAVYLYPCECDCRAHLSALCSLHSLCDGWQRQGIVHIQGSHSASVAHAPMSVELPVQDFPTLEKQPKWDSSVKPDKVKWDAEIKAALEKGKDVPEVTWVKPGEEEAMKARHHPCIATSAMPDAETCHHWHQCTMIPTCWVRDAGRAASLCWRWSWCCM